MSQRLLRLLGVKLPTAIYSMLLPTTKTSLPVVLLRLLLDAPAAAAFVRGPSHPHLLDTALLCL